MNLSEHVTAHVDRIEFRRKEEEHKYSVCSVRWFSQANYLAMAYLAPSSIACSSRSSVCIKKVLKQGIESRAEFRMGNFFFFLFFKTFLTLLR